jgi:hypothetical protein
MRSLSVVLLVAAAGCTGALYQTYAGTVTSNPKDAYTCVSEQLTRQEYRRTQFNPEEGWYLAEKGRQSQNASGLYRKTVDVLDVKAKPAASGGTDLSITAHTYEEYANARGVDRQEQAASEEVKRDAQVLARACSGATP